MARGEVEPGSAQHKALRIALRDGTISAGARGVSSVSLRALERKLLLDYKGRDGSKGKYKFILSLAGEHLAKVLGPVWIDDVEY